MRGVYKPAVEDFSSLLYFTSWVCACLKESDTNTVECKKLAFIQNMCQKEKDERRMD